MYILVCRAEMEKRSSANLPKRTLYPVCQSEVHERCAGALQANMEETPSCLGMKLVQTFHHCLLVFNVQSFLGVQVGKHLLRTGCKLIESCYSMVPLLNPLVQDRRNVPIGNFFAHLYALCLECPMAFVTSIEKMVWTPVVHINSRQ